MISMKKSRILQRLALLLTVVMVTCGAPSLSALAGTSEIIIDSETLLEEINESKWNNPDGKVQADNGTAVFPEDSTEETRLITRTAVRLSPQLEQLACVEAKVDFKNLPQGKEFILAFGLATVEALHGQAGNIELSFTNNNGLVFGVTAYDENGDALEILAAQKIGSISKTTLSAVITTEGHLVAKINGKQVCDKALPVSGEGRIGFLQTGGCHVRVSEMKVTSYRYETPENCDIFEDFEKGEFNKNLLTSKMPLSQKLYYPQRIAVEEYEGNQVLMFYNSGPGYIGTTHPYSNFEISFDVPYLQREDEVDEEGNIVRCKSELIGVSFGGETADYKTYGYTTATDMVLFRQNNMVSFLNSGDPTYPEKYKFFDKEAGAFSIKVTMVDSLVTVYMKWLEETEYTQVNSYYMNGETPTGYVHIWSNGRGNFAIDNLSIKNLDKQPQLIGVKYASSNIAKPEDYNYQPMEMVYASLADEEVDNTFPWHLLVIFTAIACAVVFGVVIAIQYAGARKGKRREENSHDEK